MLRPKCGCCQALPLLKLEAPPLLSKDELAVYLQDELLIDMPGLRKLSNDDLWTLLQAVRTIKNAKT